MCILSVYIAKSSIQFFLIFRIFLTLQSKGILYCLGDEFTFFAAGWTKEEFSWTEYLAQTGSIAALDDAFRKVRLPLLLSMCRYKYSSVFC